ncbi:MAG: hypothetical protein COA84_14720 [Robiginitomaculum sp.]|nr:MAG: hypothetical protein COA84_14720 [Robiginitomaculum sp.]
MVRLRAAGIAKEVQELLKRDGINIDQGESLLALSDIHEWLHEDIFYYHSSTIAEFLNNIRWDIYSYLQPEYRRSIIWESSDPPKYRYTYPDEVKTSFG